MPIASQQTLTIADSMGNIIIVECNAENLEIIKPNTKENFVTTANEFNSKRMKKYNNYNIDNWKAEERYLTSYNALKENNHEFSIELTKIFYQVNMVLCVNMIEKQMQIQFGL